MKNLLGKQSYSWVSAGLPSNGPGLEKVCPECGTILELEMMLLVQLSVHLRKPLCCVFSGKQILRFIYLEYDKICK